ncbi:MAG TPA: hypothetical protein VN133_10275 [Humibacter sp.]|nr:hypothetical protein [Humibacter sp.]
MTPYEFASIVVAALGLLGGVIGFFRSIAAGRRSAEAEAKAADAQADAAAALRKSAAADERIARALEAIAEHEGGPGARTMSTEPHHAGADAGEDVRARLEALIPEQVVRWQVEVRPEPGGFRLRNLGTVSATAVTIESDPNGPAPGGSGPGGQAGTTLLPGQALIFRASGQARVVHVRWSDRTSDAARLAAVPIPDSGVPAAR